MLQLWQIPVLRETRRALKLQSDTQPHAMHHGHKYEINIITTASAKAAIATTFDNDDNDIVMTNTAYYPDFEHTVTAINMAATADHLWSQSPR